MNYIGEEIRTTSGNPLYSKNMECHRASDVLDSFISKYYTQEEAFCEFIRNTTDTNEIIGYIQICLHHSLLDDNDHFMLSLQCHGHFFAIEILKQKFRILSSSSGKHSLCEYLTLNKFGNFQKKTKQLFASLRKLNSGNKESIIHAKRKLFGSGAKFPNDRITPLTLMTIYKLVKKPNVK
jgi:hypothetical protein